jgi:hypothetical protein
MAAAAVSLTACSGSGSGATPTAAPNAPGSTSSDDGTGTNISAPPVSEASQIDATQSPFSIALGFDPVLGYESGAAIDRSIAACMGAAGFEYVPVSVPDDAIDLAARNNLGRPSPWFAYGLTTGSSLVDASGQAIVDPNEAITGSMSPETLTAYTAALFGGDDGSAGCAATASATFYGETGDFPAFLTQAVIDIRSRAAADPDVLEIQRAWSACMSAAGYDFADRDQIIAAVQAMLVGMVDETTGLVDDQIRDEAAAFENSVAAVDIGCDDATGLTEGLRRAIVDEQSAYLAERPDVAAALAEYGSTLPR